MPDLADSVIVVALLIVCLMAGVLMSMLMSLPPGPKQ